MSLRARRRGANENSLTIDCAATSKVTPSLTTLQISAIETGMPSNIRKAVAVSMISMLPALAGCPDPQGRFDEFAGKFPDGGSLPDTTGNLADISGTFLFGLFVPATAALRPPQAIANVTYTAGASPKATFAIQFLDINTRTLVGDVATYPDIAINSDGTFLLSIPQLILAATATDLGSQVTAMDVALMGVIKDANFYCGT